MAGTGQLSWHGDQSWLPRLKTVSHLEAVELPEEPTPTYFCNMYAAYETLPRTLRHRLEDKHAIHDAHRIYLGGRSNLPWPHRSCLGKSSRNAARRFCRVV